MPFTTENASDHLASRQELRPLPTRVTKVQYARLVAARDRDAMSIQEHVRRALDMYLQMIEQESEARAESARASRRAKRADSVNGPESAVPNSTRRAAAPKVVRR